MANSAYNQKNYTTPVDLTSQVSGTLPIGNGGTSSTTASAARTSLGVAIGTDVQAYNANLTTWAGKTTPTGAVVGTSDTQTVTGKRNQPRTSSTTSTAALTPDLSSANVYYLTAQSASLTINAPVGTPVIGEVLAIYITTAASQSLTLNAAYVAYGTGFPSATTAGKTTMIVTQHMGGNVWATTVTTQV